jgi:hypothetical protein
MPTMRLMEQIKPEELVTVSSDLCAAITALEAKQREKKEIPGIIKGLEMRVHELKEALVAGQIERDIEVDEIPDFEAGKMRITRRDNGAPVGDRPLNEDERQVTMGSVADRIRELADEQREAATPDEAEELRDQRLAEERAERMPELRRRWTALLAELQLTATCEETTDGRDEKLWVARLETATWTSEAEGATSDEAGDNLIEKAIESLEADAAEVRKLAGEQAADDAKDKPRRGLKAPTKGPKPKSHKKSGGDEEPPTDADGHPVGF